MFEGMTEEMLANVNRNIPACAIDIRASEISDCEIAPSISALAAKVIALTARVEALESYGKRYA